MKIIAVTEKQFEYLSYRCTPNQHGAISAGGRNLVLYAQNIVVVIAGETSIGVIDEKDFPSQKPNSTLEPSLKDFISMAKSCKTQTVGE